MKIDGVLMIESLIYMIGASVQFTRSHVLQEIIGVAERQREDKLPCMRKVVLERSSVSYAKEVFKSSIG